MGFPMMTSFLAEFVHTENGFTCSESGFRDLSTRQQCSGAVSYARSFNSKARYVYGVHSRNRPSGCYILASGEMDYNTHSDGRGSSSTTSICMKGNT